MAENASRKTRWRAAILMYVVLSLLIFAALGDVALACSAILAGLAFGLLVKAEDHESQFLRYMPMIMGISALGILLNERNVPYGTWTRLVAILTTSALMYLFVYQLPQMVRRWLSERHGR